MPIVDLNECLKCFACISTCPNGAILESQKGPVFDNKKCKKCGTCVTACPVNAIKL